MCLDILIPMQQATALLFSIKAVSQKSQSAVATMVPHNKLFKSHCPKITVVYFHLYGLVGAAGLLHKSLVILGPECSPGMFFS